MHIRALTVEEFAATREQRRQAFGPLPDDEWERLLVRARPGIDAGRALGGFVAGQIVATAYLHDQIQWWHGRSLRLGGLSGVTVAAEARGRGYGRAIATAALDRCKELGFPLSMLYPATTSLYRALGWEHGGGLDEVSLDPDALRSLRAEPVDVRRVGPDDAAEVAATVARVHREARDCGPIGWDTERWRSFLSEPNHDAYLAEDGFLTFHWQDEGEIRVNKAVAVSERTTRALWAIVGSGSTTADRVTALLAAHDPVLWAIPQRFSDRVRRVRWMLRVVDAPAAVAGRGFPPGVAASVPLRLDDPDVPGNTGDWRLTVADGSGVLEPAPATSGALRLGPGAFAALYSGVPSATLRRAGRLDRDEPVLDAVFAADAHALDFF
ncbi:GNAT family N-acetyltransferase [Actinomadura rayongensis]|uniref:GNAT family N-acetyltransferase n=1 Tax=Actinomadura rayongensis TaxID=1429076 RepID=A0A6I4W9J3_9ACTN|nr:GNAT family N-acetyltransferase [Actinomadura rayongensis]MXQ67499.1 GNAT family N-acetyltransferase [Actinomadura rayongensis]